MISKQSTKIIITVKDNTANFSKQHSYIQNTAILSILTVIMPKKC